MSDSCYLYFHTNSTSCNIPCKLEGCRKELHHSILCPIWKCHDVLTTSTSTTMKTTTIVPTTTTTNVPTTTTTIHVPTTPTTTISTTTIFPPTTTPFFPIPIDHPGVTYTSLALNCFLFLALVYIFLKKCKKGLIRRIHNFRNRNQNDSEQQPILGSSGNSGTRRRRQQNRQPRNRNVRAPLRQNNDDYFTLSNSSEEEVDGFARVQLHSNPSTSPRVPSFLNSPVAGSVPGTNFFRDPLGYFWPQPPQPQPQPPQTPTTQTLTIGTQTPAPISQACAPLSQSQRSQPPDSSAVPHSLPSVSHSEAPARHNFASAQPITIPIQTQKPSPPPLPTRSPTTSLSSTFKPSSVRSNI